MGYGDYPTHLLDQDTPVYPVTWQGASAPIAMGRPAPMPMPVDAYTNWVPHPSAPMQPIPGPWPVRPDLQGDVVGPSMAPHQLRLAAFLARDHGHAFKVELNAFFSSGAPSVRAVCDHLQQGRSLPQRLGLVNQTVGILLKVFPCRIAITPDGFFSVAQPPFGRQPGQLAPLCSADFLPLGTPADFMHQVQAELNGLLRNRRDMWRVLLLFTKPKKNLHTCRTMQH